MAMFAMEGIISVKRLWDKNSSAAQFWTILKRRKITKFCLIIFVLL